MGDVFSQIMVLRSWSLEFVHQIFVILFTDKENKQHIIDNGGISMVINCLSRYLISVQMCQSFSLGQWSPKV